MVLRLLGQTRRKEDNTPATVVTGMTAGLWCSSTTNKQRADMRALGSPSDSYQIDRLSILAYQL